MRELTRRCFIKAAGGVALAPSVRRSTAQPAEYDYIIVGAGSSGCVLAYRLSADPSVRVLLVEAGRAVQGDERIATPGRWPSLIGSEWDWGYATDPEPDLEGRRILFPRGKALGGSSAINAMTYVRGHRLDFEAWRDAGDTTWGWTEVLPLFKRSEDNSRGASEYHGSGGPLAVSDTSDAHVAHEAFLGAAREIGYAADPQWDFNGHQQENGAGYYQKNIRRGARHDAAQAFLGPIVARANLTLVTAAQASRLLFEGRRIVGLEYVWHGRREAARTRREVILCAGVVGSPKLMMLSGLGPAAHLREMQVPVLADLPGVGRNLQDHVKVSVRWRCRETLPASTVSTGLFVRSGHQPADAPPGLQFYLGRGTDQPDQLVTMTVALEQPRSRGDIRLRSTSLADPPIIRARYLAESADVDALLDGVRALRALAGTRAFANVRKDELEPGADVVSRPALETFIRRTADTIYHPAGTCRMGRDQDAVVDARLRVRGVDGLRVADASIMPNVVNGNTHAACVMIGERAADLVRGSTSRR